MLDDKTVTWATQRLMGAYLDPETGKPVTSGGLIKRVNKGWVLEPNGQRQRVVEQRKKAQQRADAEIEKRQLQAQKNTAEDAAFDEQVKSDPAFAATARRMADLAEQQRVIDRKVTEIREGLSQTFEMIADFTENARVSNSGGRIYQQPTPRVVAERIAMLLHCEGRTTKDRLKTYRFSGKRRALVDDALKLLTDLQVVSKVGDHYDLITAAPLGLTKRDLEQRYAEERAEKAARDAKRAERQAEKQQSKEARVVAAVRDRVKGKLTESLS